MADPWDQFADADQGDEWSQFADADNMMSRGVAKRPSTALGFYAGVTRPVDNAAMALEAGARRIGVPVDQVNNLFAMPSAREAATQHQQFIANSDRRPGAAGTIAGEIVGTLPTWRIRNPFAQGAAQGALLTDSDKPAGVATDAAIGAGLNWFGGKVADTVGDMIAPVIDPAVRRMAEKGVSLTPGMVKGGKAMVKEDRRMSRPVVGPAIAAARQQTQSTFNTAAVNEALAPIGKKVPSVIKPGFDSLSYAKTEIGRAYDTVIPNVAVKIDGQQFATNIAPVARNLKPAQQKQLRQIVSNELGTGQLAGQDLKRAQTQIRRLAGKFSRSQDANDQLLGEALSAVDDELTGAMISQNPRYAPELQRANEAYRGYRVVADAAGRADDGLFTTGQLKQSVRRGDFSKSKDATARGQAFMQEFSNDARTVLPSRTPDSGTAGRMMEGNLFANLGGGMDRAGYAFDTLYQRSRLAPRPPVAQKAAKAVRRLKGPVAAGAVAASSQPRD